LKAAKSIKKSPPKLLLSKTSPENAMITLKTISEVRSIEVLQKTEKNGKS